MVRCCVQPFQIDDVLDGLREFEVWNLTVTGGWERPRARDAETFVVRGCLYKPRLLPTMVVDVTVADYVVDDIVRVLSERCKSGPKADERPLLIIPIATELPEKNQFSVVVSQLPFTLPRHVSVLVVEFVMTRSTELVLFEM